MTDLSKPIYLYDDGIGYVQYVQHTGTDKTIVDAARVSFDKDKITQSDKLSDRDKKLIKYLIKHRHTSTLEHNLITLKFKVPLFVRGQHHRHRTWSYNEVSRRYTKENLEFLLPKSFRTQHESNKQASVKESSINPVVEFLFNPHMTASFALQVCTELCVGLYKTLLGVGVCREQARMILPQNMYVTYIGTVNLNNLLKFLTLRLDEHSQEEIQVVAKACLDIAEELWPNAIGIYRELYWNDL